MSIMTTSARFFSAMERATVAPTLPAPPTTVTFRFIGPLLGHSSDCSQLAHRSYQQLLWKTLLKTDPPVPILCSNPHVSALCTIVVRTLHRARRYHEQ